MKQLLPALVGVAAAASVAAAGTVARQSLFFDATYTKAETAGPPATEVGHVQLADGVLRDARGHAVGRFAFTCRWTAILAGDDARERCSGWARTADGRLDAVGPSRVSDEVHAWTVRGTSGAYRGTRGTVVVRDLGAAESLLSVTLSSPAPVRLRIAALPMAAANDGFRARANALCAAAARRLAAPPQFPFADFDPLHPDPELLPKVGRFFTGPGDPRPILRALDARLHALGRPPADTAAWARVLAARRRSLLLRDVQDRAALAADSDAFVRSVRHVSGAYRRVAVTATVFGATSCVL
jgi:hypothetical protein